MKPATLIQDVDAYPFTNRWFKTPEGHMHYLDEGPRDGGRPALVFVHGTPTWSYLYRHMIRSLGGGWHCIAVDHLGYGLSDKPVDGAYAPADHARRLGALIDHLRLDRFVLVGHDFGGPIGLAAALERAPRLRGTVLLNTWAWDLRADPNARKLGRLLQSPLGSVLYRWFNASPRWLVPLAFADRSRLTPAIHQAYLVPFARRQDREAPLAAGRSLLSPWFATLEPKLAALANLPAALIWGARDPAFGQAALARWRSLLPHAEVTAFPDVGHFPQEERPVETTQALQAFLERLDGAEQAWSHNNQRRAG